MMMNTKIMIIFNLECMGVVIFKTSNFISLNSSANSRLIKMLRDMITIIVYTHCNREEKKGSSKQRMIRSLLGVNRLRRDALAEVRTASFSNDREIRDIGRFNR
jgi:hypothetical protein